MSMWEASITATASFAFPGPASFPRVADYFTPWDQAMLNSYDEDVASGGVLLLPDQPGAPYPHLLVQAGKEGTIDLVNRDDMGHFNPAGDTQIVQTLPGIISGVWGAPAMWNNNLYFGGAGASAWRPSTTIRWRSKSRRTTPPQLRKVFAFPGPTPSVSANGTSNAIVWIIETDAYQTAASPSCGPTMPPIWRTSFTTPT